jgi:hypothetical protein
MKYFFSRIVFVIFVGTFCTSILLTQNQQSDITSLLPDSTELGLWHPSDSIRVFNGEELYAFIDGGADIYFEYGFRRVVAAEYQNNNRIFVRLEIYEMADTAAAYGMFSINSGVEGKTVKIGNGGMLNEYYLIFWKDKFLTFISSDDTTGGTLEAILAIAESIDKKIAPVGEKPEIAKSLPQNGLHTCKYVRGLLGLSSVYDFDTKNIFGVRDGVIGIYRDHSVFIFEYDSEESIKRWFNNARGILKTSTRYSKFEEQGRGYSINDQKNSQLYITYLGNLVVIVMADQGSSISTRFNEIISTIKKTN